MITLSYGYLKPQTPDRGPTVFPAMEQNIQRLNDHTHDGANSAPLPASSIQGGSVNAPSGSWVSQGGGQYRQLVTLPSAYDFDKQSITVRTSTGEYVWAKIEKVSTTQFYVWTNDNTESFVCVVGG